MGDEVVSLRHLTIVSSFFNRSAALYELEYFDESIFDAQLGMIYRIPYIPSR